MHKRLAASVLILAALFPIAPNALSQSILDQDRDELLKGFDVDPSTLSQSQPKQTPLATAGHLLKFLSSALPSVSVQTSGGEPNIRVKAPFVNVTVGSAQTGIKVRAPFVHIDAGSPEPADPAITPPPADDPPARSLPDSQSPSIQSSESPSK